MKRLPPPPAPPGSDTAEVFGEILATRGFVSNVLSSMGHAPGGLRHLARLGAYCKYDTDLPERQRELSILCAARGVPYAWDHHSALAIQAGIPPSAVDAIGAGRTPSDLPASEQALARYLSVLFSPAPMDDAVFAELSHHFSPRQITDITMSATYYGVLATMVKAFGVELEGEAVLKVEQDWQKAKAGL